MRYGLVPAMLAAMPALAGTAGPPAPVKAKATPAQTAITNYHQSYDAAEPPKPCQRATGGEIVVCGVDGRGGSPDRLPLPGERGAPALRIATGEAPHMSVGGSPVHRPGMGLTVRVTNGKIVVAKSDVPR